MRERCIRAVKCFLCNNIAGWSYKTQQKTTCEMHDDRLMFSFVTTLQGWAYKLHERDACERSSAFFVTTLQGLAYKSQQTTTARCLTR